jgi:acyl carrier protein
MSGPEDLAERLVAIWRGVLKTTDVHADTNLLDLAVTSLTAVRIRSRIRAELGKEIELIDILDHPSPRELAMVIAAAPAWAGPQPWQQLDWSADPEPDDASI